MKISTSLVENKISKNGGTLKMKYNVMINGGNIENEILFEIKKEQKI